MKKALDAIALDGDDDDEEVDEAEEEAELVEAAAQLEEEEKKRAKKEKKSGKVELPVLAEVKALVGGSLPEGSIETVVKAEKKDKKKKRKVCRFLLPFSYCSIR